MSEIDWSSAPEWATRLMRNRYNSPDAWADNARKAIWVTDFVRGSDKTFTLDERVWTLVDKRPSPQWSGKGLPPVGIECERNVSLYNWCQSMVYAHSPCGRFAAFWDSCGRNWASADSFRPMRTPEQIVTEERERAISEMVGVVDGKCSNSSREDARDYSTALYDAGYRKVEGGVK